MSQVGRYRKVFVRMWRHPAFICLSDAEKALALYLLTGPQTNRLGLYCLSIATAAEDLRTLPGTLKKRLIKVCEAFGWVFDSRSRVFYIPSWFKWNPAERCEMLPQHSRLNRRHGPYSRRRPADVAGSPANDSRSRCSATERVRRSPVLMRATSQPRCTTGRTPASKIPASGLAPNPCCRRPRIDSKTTTSRPHHGDRRGNGHAERACDLRHEAGTRQLRIRNVGSARYVVQCS